MSAASQPNCSRIRAASALAPSSSPQMNIVGGPPGEGRVDHEGVADRGERLDEARRRAPRLQPLHQRVVGAGEVRAARPFSGGASAIGLVASMTTLPARVPTPASATASSAAVPLTASTTTRRRPRSPRRCRCGRGYRRGPTNRPACWARASRASPRSHGPGSRPRAPVRPVRSRAHRSSSWATTLPAPRAHSSRLGREAGRSGASLRAWSSIAADSSITSTSSCVTSPPASASTRR